MGALETLTTDCCRVGKAQGRVRGCVAKYLSLWTLEPNSLVSYTSVLTQESYRTVRDSSSSCKE